MSDPSPRNYGADARRSDGSSQGRYVATTPDELNAWLGKESGKPVHVATGDTDLTAELKRGLSFVQNEEEVISQISDFVNSLPAKR